MSIQQGHIRKDFYFK